MSSPLAEISASLGAVFDGGDRMGVPVHFGDWEAEYQSAHESVAICDCSPMSKIELNGRDRAKFLNNLCTNDIMRLPVGAGCEAFLTNAQGKILFHVRAFVAADSIWVDTIPDAASALLAHLDRYRITERVDLSDRTAELAQLLVIGPQAAHCLSTASGVAVPQLADLGHSEIALDGTRCSLVRNDGLVCPAFELRVPTASVAAIWQKLSQAGQPLGLRPMGTKALDAIRIEAGWPVYGRDIDASNLPQEVGRTARAVSFNKGCYLGQETVARIDALGHVNRHLVGLMLSESDLPDHGARIVSDDRPVGQITSSAYSPLLRRAIALGYVRRGHERPGTKLVIDLRGKAAGAEVCTLPVSERHG